VAIAHADSVLRLLCKRGLVLIRIAAELVSHFLCGRFLALRLSRRCGRIALAFEFVGKVLSGRLLGVGLELGASLVGEGLSASVGHYELIYT